MTRTIRAHGSTDRVDRYLLGWPQCTWERTATVTMAKTVCHVRTTRDSCALPTNLKMRSEIAVEVHTVYMPGAPAPDSSRGGVAILRLGDAIALRLNEPKYGKASRAGRNPESAL
jgi:hypothetical protein